MRRNHRSTTGANSSSFCAGYPVIQGGVIDGCRDPLVLTGTLPHRIKEFDGALNGDIFTVQAPFNRPSAVRRGGILVRGL